MTVSSEVESWVDWRARRRREVSGRWGPVSLYWGNHIIEPDQRVDGAPGRWSALPDGRAGLLVRATADEHIVIGGTVVDGEAVLYYDEADGPTVAEFPDGAEGIVFSYDRIRYALQVWNSRSEWALRFHDIAAFPEDPSWVVDATVTPVTSGRTVTITHHRHPEPVEVPVVADVEFIRDGHTFRLAATAAGPDRDLLFVHFRDATSGGESYGAGRGLRFPGDHGGTVRLDFNRATLLPCSFSRAWNCPLPPAENTLPIPVRAGERNAIDTGGTPLL